MSRGSQPPAPNHPNDGFKHTRDEPRIERAQAMDEAQLHRAIEDAAPGSIWSSILQEELALRRAKEATRAANMQSWVAIGIAFAALAVSLMQLVL